MGGMGRGGRAENFIKLFEQPMSSEEPRELLNTVRDYKILRFSNKTPCLLALFAPGNASFITISTGLFFLC